jgi:enoyl-CoA hydratase/carnithine racemase
VADAPVLLERLEDGIAIVRLNRPEKRNALDTASLDRLNGLLDELARDDALRVLVLSTTNSRAFCAGADIGERLDAAGGLRRMVAFTHMYAALEAFPVPVITGCVGNCVGAGAEIVAGSDLRVGGDNLVLAWVGARLGVPVGPARLAPLIGVAGAKDLVLTGRTLDQAQANALGLLHRLAAAADTEAAAVGLAREVAAQSPDGVRALKQLFRRLDGTAERVAIENEALLRFQRHGPGLPRG